MADYPEALLEFWFETLEPEQWWIKDPVLDARIAERYRTLHARASQGELFGWRETARGRLAEVIVLDQFSRNIFRDSPRAFAADGMALVLAQEAVAGGHDRGLTSGEKAFLYMPYMHSESQAIHRKAVRLFSAPGLEQQLAFEQQHQVIIDRFGRYPHRNAILGRSSTPEEVAFLESPGSSF